MKLNKVAFNNAKKLIEGGEWKQTDKWEPPTAEEENAFIEKNGGEEYSKWYLGINEDLDSKTKQYYSFPYSDDFKKVNRKGLIAIKQRAAQYGYDDIFKASSELLDLIDAKEEGKRYSICYRVKNLESNNDIVDDVRKFVITDEQEDRVGDVMVISGVRYENFMKNPIVLWNHDDYSLPIGKVLNIEKIDNKLIVSIQFSKTNEMATKIKDLIDEGILNAVSIGFRPLKYEYIDKGDPSKGVKYLEWELLEVSVVNIPANPRALIVKYLNLKDVKEFEKSKNKDYNSEEKAFMLLNELKRIKNKFYKL